MQKFLNLYFKFVISNASWGSFTGAVILHILFTSVILTAAFAYGYAKATIGRLHPDIIFALLAGLLLAVIIHAFLFNVLAVIRLRSPIPIIRRINKFFNGIHLIDGFTVSEYKLLLKDMVRLPLVQTWLALPDILIVLTPIICYDYFYLETGNIAYYLIAGAISLPIHAQFAYVTADLHLGPFRSEVKRKIFEMGSHPPNFHSFSLKIKFVLILSIIILAGYILITLMNSEMIKEKKAFIDLLLFTFFALSLLIVLAIMYFSSIFIAVKELQNAADALKAGEDPDFFSRTSDLELANLSSGFFTAAQKVLNYQKDLQKQVSLATEDLRSANTELQEKDKEIQMELDFARDIQQSIIPKEPHSWNGISFAAVYLPMGKVSGDYYDIFRTKSSVFALLCDVSGHGVPAAFITMSAKQAFSSYVRPELTPAEIYRQVNHDLVNRITTQDYMTAFMLKINEANRVTFSNASHQKAIYVSAKGDIRELDTGGLFIGAMEEANDSYEDGELQLQSGDRIIMFTDGIVEHKNEEGEEFGEDRLVELIKTHRTSTLHEMHENIITELQSFMGSAPVRDDISMFSIELHPRWAEFVKIFNTGMKALKNKDFVSARSNLHEAHDLIPTYPRIKLNLARLEFADRDLETARKYLNEYLDVFPDDIKGLHLQAELGTQLENENMIQSALYRIRRIDPEHPLLKKLKQS